MKAPVLHRPTREQWVGFALGALPWTWYLVRDLSGRMDIVALAWPVLGTIAVGSLLLGAAIEAAGVTSIAVASGE